MKPAQNDEVEVNVNGPTPAVPVTVNSQVLALEQLSVNCLNVENVVKFSIQLLAVVDSGIDRTTVVGVADAILTGITYAEQTSSAANSTILGKPLPVNINYIPFKETSGVEIVLITKGVVVLNTG